MNRVSRRALLKAAVAPALLGTAASSARATIGSGPSDAAIIGAGAAGIGAAQKLRDPHVSYVILEARDRQRMEHSRAGRMQPFERSG